MNVAPIAFRANAYEDINPVDLTPAYPKRIYATDPKSETDRFTPSHLEKTMPRKKKKHIISPFARGVLLGGILAAALTSFAQKPQGPVKYTVPKESSITIQLEDLERNYGTSSDMILYYNDCDNEEELAQKEEFSFPSIYSYIDESIEEVKKELNSSKLSAEKRDELEEKLSQLVEKKKQQEETAVVYSDGKMLYYQIIKEEGINVENFKDLFDIKDGFIRSNNHISSVWKVDGEYDPNTNDGYFDYSLHRIKEGEIIKIPMKGIDN